MIENTRRNFLKSIGKTAVAIPLCGILPQSAFAAAKVDPQGGTAKALQYTHQSTMADQNCLGCQLYNAGDTDGWGSCPIFPGQLVAAQGWCVSWVKKV